jgi:hypothetical protein
MPREAPPGLAADDFVARIEVRTDPGAEPLDPADLDDALADLLLAMLASRGERAAAAAPAGPPARAKDNATA